MNNWSPSSVYLALLHHPVKNKNGETIASAVTNLDLHDLSRLAKTYGVTAVYVITPLTDQQALVRKIISHWQDGWGATYNPKRREALNLIRIAENLESAIDEIRTLNPAQLVRTIATGAAENSRAMPFDLLRQKMASETGAYLLVLGTAWGLTDEVMAASDFLLSPIRGHTSYNHLSVRAAAAIILDRVLGME
ncbi:MAG TPA: RNA methyltransferase [Desulfosalsimonadaceae bacterium]|nr:RNA methyltransferase [Desulfosalsimonadaceae bacterium]